MSRRPVHHAIVLVAAVVGGALVWPWSLPQHAQPAPAPAVVPSASASVEAPVIDDHAEHTDATCAANRTLSAPSGAPPRLSCRAARAIVSEMHARFAGEPSLPSPQPFGTSMLGWIDPHGLWSAAPDAPLRRALKDAAPALIEELRRPADTAEPCEHFEALGAQLSRWVGELERTYDRVAKSTRPVSRHRAAVAARAAAFQDDPVTEPAKVLTRRLARDVARFEHAFSSYGEAAARAAHSRYFPELDASGWAEVVLAAAVRAYVPLLDPHGDWAPFEEEWSLYSDDPGLDGEPRLWHEITRTAVGVRIVDGAHAPLAAGDLVLAVDGISTAGMPLEQAEQLGRLEPQDHAKRHLQVLRRDRSEIEELDIDVGWQGEGESDVLDLSLDEVRYGDGRVLAVRIPDVPDGLGEALGHVLARARQQRVKGVLLDLRGNGGGSTDAAAAVLSFFLPNAPLFPLSTHDRLVEVMRAAEPPADERFDGPVATLVDGYTASAAEMIAGALSAYGRGQALGARTFGKGCIQEYVNDNENKGVLRVTTLLFSLPNGSPVQRTGLTPDVLIESAPGREHEGDLPHALPSYRGPDVRDRRIANRPQWPLHHGRVGPCVDHGVCRALWQLGAAPVPRANAARRIATRVVAAASPTRANVASVQK